MSEVDTRFEQLSHGYNTHYAIPPLVCFRALTVSRVVSYPGKGCFDRLSIRNILSIRDTNDHPVRVLIMVFCAAQLYYHKCGWYTSKTFVHHPRLFLTAFSFRFSTFRMLYGNAFLPSDRPDPFPFKHSLQLCHKNQQRTQHHQQPSRQIVVLAGLSGSGGLLRVGTAHL